MDLHALKEKVFNHELTQQQKLDLMEEIFSLNLSHNFSDLHNLLSESIDRKDVQVMGYCLAKSEEFDLDALFLNCCEYGFVKGAQLIAYQLDLPSYSKKDDLLSEAFIKSLHVENVEEVFKFLTNKGGDISKDENFILRYAYEENNLHVIKLLIQSYRLPKSILQSALNVESQSAKAHYVNQLYEELDKQNNIKPIEVIKPLAKVLHRKI